MWGGAVARRHPTYLQQSPESSVLGPRSFRCPRSFRDGEDGVVKLLALGVDHRRAPAPVREALAFEGARRDEGLNALAKAFPGGEFVVLSTCNRVEVYAAGPP